MYSTASDVGLENGIPRSHYTTLKRKIPRNTYKRRRGRGEGDKEKEWETKEERERNTLEEKHTGGETHDSFITPSSY